MGDDAIYADGSPELFDAASDLLMDKVMKTRKVKEQQIYDLAIKALDYYREYLQQPTLRPHHGNLYRLAFGIQAGESQLGSVQARGGHC